MESHELDALPGAGTIDSSPPPRADPASIRRRCSREIRSAVLALAEHQTATPFTAYTLPILEDLRHLLLALADAEGEGYAREVVRRLRDTLSNGGWERYREAAVREAVAGLLAAFAEAAEVDAPLLARTEELVRRHGLTDALAGLKKPTPTKEDGDDGRDEVPR